MGLHGQVSVTGYVVIMFLCIVVKKARGVLVLAGLRLAARGYCVDVSYP